jgi:hypothetical protein
MVQLFSGVFSPIELINVICSIADKDDYRQICRLEVNCRSDRIYGLSVGAIGGISLIQFEKTAHTNL